MGDFRPATFKVGKSKIAVTSFGDRRLRRTLVRLITPKRLERCRNIFDTFFLEQGTPIAILALTRSRFAHWVTLVLRRSAGQTSIALPPRWLSLALGTDGSCHTPVRLPPDPIGLVGRHLRMHCAVIRSELFFERIPAGLSH